MNQETLNQGFTLKINKFNSETGELIESVEFVNGDKVQYRLDEKTREEIVNLLSK